ncbi:hypothetical protein FACS1894137_02210 [Spirochaetia bacterium]|nr:hypothetical protein FACS1894137_02210 [Spirochaetia bacterium]
MNKPVQAEGGTSAEAVYRLVRFAIQLLVFLALVVVSTFLLRPLERAVQLRMTELRDGLLSKAERFLDRRIEYASMGPSLFGVLDIRNIRIYASDTEPELTIDRFRLAYSFWDLIRGKLPESIRSIRIDRPVLSLDLNRNRDPGNPADSEIIDPRNDTIRRIASLIPEDILLRVRGGEFRILTGENTIRVEGLNFDTHAEAGNFLFSGKWSARADLAGLFNQSLGLSMSGRVNGELSRNLDRGSMQLRIPAFSGDSFVLRPLTLNLSLTEQEIEIRKINDRLPFDFSLNYVFDTRNLSASFRAEDFSPRDLLTFIGPWRKYNPYLNIRSSGFAEMRHSPGRDRGSTSYEIDLSGSLPNAAGGGISYAVAGKGDETYFRFTRCDFRLPQGELAYAGGLGLSPLAPDGTLQVKDFSLTGDGEINGDFTISSSGRSINIFGESVTLGTVAFSALNGDLVRENAGFSFALSALRFRNIESYEDVRLGTLSLEGSFDWDPQQLQCSLALESFSVSDLLNSIRPFTAFIPVPEIARLITEDISITTEVFVTTDFKHVLYNAPRLVAAYSGNRDIFTLVSVSGTDRRFELNEGQIAWAGGSAEASGYADFSRPDDITFFFQTSYKNMSYFLDGEYLDRRSLSIRGSYGFQLYVYANAPLGNDLDSGGYSGYVQAASIPIPWGDQFARLSLLLRLRYDDPNSWSVSVDHIDVLDKNTPGSSSSSLSIAGEINQDGLQFRRIFFDDGRDPLSGRVSASWGRGFSNPSGNLTIRNQAGAEIVSVDGSYRGEAVDIKFSGNDLRPGRFLRNSPDAVLSGNGEMHWESPDSYSAAITLGDLRARIGDADITLAGSALLNQDTLSFHDFRLRYNALEGEFPLLTIDRRSSSAQAEARIRGIFMERNLDMSFNTELNFAPIDSWFNLSQAIDSFNGVLNVQNINMDTIRSREPFNFIFSRNRTQLSLSGGPGNMLRLQVSDKGAFYAAFSSPAPFRGSVVGSISGAGIEAQTSNMFVDLTSLWRFIPGKDMVNVSGGFADLSMEIRGSLGDPEFFGSARVYSLRLQVPHFIREDIEPVPLTIDLEGNEMNFGPIPARVGSGAGTVAGWFRFDRWVPNIFKLDIRVPDKTPIPFGVEIAGIQADGDVSGHLELAMEDMILRVSGDLLGNNAEISMDTRQAFNPPEEAGEAETISTVTDLRIRTGPKVEFLYPSRDFPWIRANAEVGTGIKITNDTLSGRFTVEGDLAIRSGTIFYFQRSFYIREGILSFNESETHFDPLISARAETRDRTDEGPVTISMIVDRSPLLNFSPRFESSPSLSQFEILSLLGQNLTGAPSEDPNEPIRGFVLASTDVLAQFYPIRWLERAVRDSLHLDMFSIRTQILQNAIIQATGLWEPVDRNGGIGNYFDNTTVFLGKYFGPNVFGQAMLSFRYDENRTTFGDFSREGLTLGAGLSLEADIGIEFRGPMFDIQLNFAPSHPDRLFVDDFSVTLSWKRSVKNLSDLWKKER